MEKLFGLPAHPLLIHFPIVAIPTLCLVGLLMVLWPSFRQKYVAAAAVFGLITAVATILAAQSGEALAETYSNTDFLEKHKSLGETLRLLVIGLALAVSALMVATKRSASTGKDPFSMVASLAVLVLAVLSAIWAIRTGHEGANVTWG